MKIQYGVLTVYIDNLVVYESELFTLYDSLHSHWSQCINHQETNFEQHDETGREHPIERWMHASNGRNGTKETKSK